MAEEFSNYYTAALNTESKEIMDVHMRLDPRNMLPKKLQEYLYDTLRLDHNMSLCASNQ